MLPARRALISVFDKTGLDELARGLDRLGIEIVSTGGTLKFLQEKGIPVIAVSDVTGFPEILERPGEDAPPQDPRRHPGQAVGCGAPRRRSPSTGSSRSIWWWSISTPSADGGVAAPRSRRRSR